MSKNFTPYRPPYAELVENVSHYVIDNGNTNHATHTYDCSAWKEGVYLIAANRYQNQSESYGTSLYLMTINANNLPMITPIKEIEHGTVTLSLSSSKVLSLTYSNSAYWQVYAKLI